MTQIIQENKSRYRTKFTAREREIIFYVSIGDTNQLISEKLKISIKTIESNLHRIYGLLGIKVDSLDKNPRVLLATTIFRMEFMKEEKTTITDEEWQQFLDQVYCNSLYNKPEKHATEKFLQWRKNNAAKTTTKNS